MGLKTLLVVAIVSFLSTVGVTAAYAVSSAVLAIGPYGGIKYSNQAQLSPTSGSLTAYTVVQITSNTTGNPVPANQYAGQARIYKSQNGALCVATGMVYNTYDLSGYAVRVDGICDPGIYHYSKGRTLHYSSSLPGYLSFDTYNTPGVIP